MSHLGNAALELVTDTNKLLTAVGGTTLLFLGLYTTRETTRVVGRTVEAWLGTPKLVGVRHAGGCTADGRCTAWKRTAGCCTGCGLNVRQVELWERHCGWQGREGCPWWPLRRNAWLGAPNLVGGGQGGVIREAWGCTAACSLAGWQDIARR